MANLSGFDGMFDLAFVRAVIRTLFSSKLLTMNRTAKVADFAMKVMQVRSRVAWLTSLESNGRISGEPRFSWKGVGGITERKLDWPRKSCTHQNSVMFVIGQSDIAISSPMYASIFAKVSTLSPRASNSQYVYVCHRSVSLSMTSSSKRLGRARPANALESLPPSGGGDRCLR